MYQVLYRKWRPRTFSDVYGQPLITAALRGELRTGRIAHAYLFTGSRGTGKTSCAKILAKAVNCLDPQDGDPCNRCASCTGIDDGSILDVVEIDAASNNGVDSIRDLREEVNFTPAAAKYRVYIIDEVHMLSTGAFNALLKTLEEPPAHVIFILATTEVHKLPATILSRCQRFDFRRIAPGDIAARIQYIAEREGFTVTDDAALLIARLADGGMRDALSLLDQCVTRAKDVTAGTVADAAGLAGGEHLYEFSRAVREHDGGAALELVGRLHEASRDMERLCAELIDFYRSLMIIKSVDDPSALIVAPPAERERLRAEAGEYDLPLLLHCLESLQTALESLRAGSSRRIAMEMALLRLCAPELDTGSAALLRRVGALEDALKAGRFAPPVPPAFPESPAGAVPLEAPPARASVLPASPPSSADVPAARPVREPAEQPFPGWDGVVQALAVSCPPLYGVLQDSTAALRGDLVLVDAGASNELFKSLVRRDGNSRVLVDAIRGVTGRTCRVGIRRRAETPPADDSLSDFIRGARDKGVDVDVK